ncbi:hypothetical protein [Parachlamydia sp. AcF125]|uniref:hypothetical protein n=1 Tax=Parachlamydia sp. AcF125 TaxID=2795736 RepID=UPI001BC8FFF1|nr:hypothetical protein [Parachlamydia sp. AcF125]MBS4168406.1 hypothetical protein [Parachlamydia sp. AcF125]
MQHTGLTPPPSPPASITVGSSYTKASQANEVSQTEEQQSQKEEGQSPPPPPSVSHLQNISKREIGNNLACKTSY